MVGLILFVAVLLILSIVAFRLHCYQKRLEEEALKPRPLDTRYEGDDFHFVDKACRRKDYV